MQALIPHFARPHVYLDSVLDLQIDALKQQQIRALLLDVDCTLKNHGTSTLNPGVAGWLDSLRAADIKLCLLSNGRRQRIKKLAGTMDLPYIAQAFKPFPFGCWAAIRQLGLPRENIALVGDQLFADVMAGRLAGLYTYLVRPSSSVEPWFTRLKRPFERRVLSCLKLDCICSAHLQPPAPDAERVETLAPN